MLSKLVHAIANQPVACRWGPAGLFLALGLAILFAPLPFPSPIPTDRLIRIEASTFQFTPGTLKVNPGDRVTVELVSTDVEHGLSLDGYGFVLTAIPGQPASGTFIAGQAGVSRFRCPVACGNLHPFMLGLLQVGPDLLLVRGIALGLLGIIAGIYLPFR
jgi:plastocyanin